MTQSKRTRRNFVGSMSIGVLSIGLVGCASRNGPVPQNGLDAPRQPNPNSPDNQNTNGDNVKSYLEITLKIDPDNRGPAAEIYKKYKQPFLESIDGAKSKQLLLRDEDVQVLHGFADEKSANAYLSTSLFKDDVVRELGPLLAADPDMRVYSVM